MEQSSGGLVQALLQLPIFEAEWVLWLLLVLSLVSVAVMIERFIFYRKRRVDHDALRAELDALLSKGDFAGSAKCLERYDSLETNIVLFGLLKYERGAEAVEDLLAGAETKERLRYNRRLGFLATVGSNAPFIGLFGTVLGIIRAFGDMADNISDASSSVMAGISEALVATAIGLLVAIPAVVAYNSFMGLVKERAGNAALLSRTLLSQLKARDFNETTEAG